MDEITLETFKWQRKRLALYEKALLEGNSDESQSSDILNTKTLLESNFDASRASRLLKQKKESDKGRVRKIKVKV